MGRSGVMENAYALSDEAFARNAHIETRETGDLSWLGNLPNRRIYRSMSATTDDIGFQTRVRCGTLPAL